MSNGCVISYPTRGFCTIDNGFTTFATIIANVPGSGHSRALCDHTCLICRSTRNTRRAICNRIVTHDIGSVDGTINWVRMRLSLSPPSYPTKTPILQLKLLFLPVRNSNATIMFFRAAVPYFYAENALWFWVKGECFTINFYAI